MDSGDVVRQHGDYVWRVVRYLGVPEDDIPDVCQEVFLVVLRRIDSVQNERQIKSWLYGICLRVVSNHRRSLRRRREVLADVPPERTASPTQHRHVERTETRAILLRLLDRLEESKRSVFVMHEIEQLPMPAIADLLGIPVGTGYSRLRAARQEMKRSLAALRMDWSDHG